VDHREPRPDQSPESTGWVEPVSTAGTARGANGSPRVEWARGPANAAEANRHGLDGAPDGGWRGWWNPESVGSPTRHSDREPVGNGRDDNGRADRTGATETHAAAWHPSPTPRQRQALPAVPPAASEPEPAQADPDASADPEIPTPRRNGEAVTANGKPGLRRRVPQAHLAPELRQAAADEPDTAPPIDNAAASALSRYQASRQAAQAVVEEAGESGGMRQ
jgi:hypothetical protein